MKEIFLMGGGNQYNNTQANFNQFFEIVEMLKDNEGYTFTVQYLTNEEQSKESFEFLFGKQRPNLQYMKLLKVKLFPNSLALFCLRQWRKLFHLELSN